MKNMIFNFKAYYLLLIFLLSATISGFAQTIPCDIDQKIQVDQTSVTNTVALGSYGNVTISVPNEALSGDNIPLNITLPGTLPAGCTKVVTVTTGDNLIFQTSGAIPFSEIAPNTYQNDTLSGNIGQNFNLFYKFPSFVTCNGEIGTFDVTIKIDCGDDDVQSYKATVNVTARAGIYWCVAKKFLGGNLVCGKSLWVMRLYHHNPNGQGLGDYSIKGTVTENPSVPVISGSSHTFNITHPSQSRTFWPYNVWLKNCQPEETVITNTADYDFILGDSCDEIKGTVSAVSDTLKSPNASISFEKGIYSRNTLAPGCQAAYQIHVYNNGNVPWSNMTITDTIKPEIDVKDVNNVAGWSVSHVGSVYTFTTDSGTVLNPGQHAIHQITFQIDPNAVVGDSICNTAHITYQGYLSESGSNGSDAGCPGINCPTIDASIQNTSSRVCFAVEKPKPLPTIKKCIVNPPNNIIPPIYQIGDIIQFSILVGNHGSAPLNTTVNDPLGTPGQNLQIIPSSISYSYYPNYNLLTQSFCMPLYVQPVSPPFPFSVIDTTDDLQNPTFTISDLPGICRIDSSNYLLIEFKAEILPQLYGSKTNTSSIPFGSGTKSSSVNYTIDQVGILKVEKRADTDIVENGQTFNYIITVSNNGSIPLDSVVINDALPECVSMSGKVSVKNNGGTVSSTQSGNIQINVNPSVKIQPGNSLTITIPVTKNGSGNCCNVNVSATGRMVTSGVNLSANYGSDNAPAACVVGTGCCEIEDFSASLTKDNGKYYVTINGGSVPIQDVDISMLDYNIKYSQKDCKPTDMGIFGTLSTTLNNLNGLVLDPNGNNTHSLNWNPGTPTILTNTTIPIQVSTPNVLDLSCCKVDFSFCLKVRVKDVNCNVCEKIICYKPEEPEPCKIDVKGLDSSYCVGDAIPISWAGGSSPVSLYLLDNSNNVYQVIAQNLPGSGSYTYTIPSGVPCSPIQEWSILIKDGTDSCKVRTNPFWISCCRSPTECDCGSWKSRNVILRPVKTGGGNGTGPIKGVSTSNKKRVDIIKPAGSRVNCGERIVLKRNVTYSITFPDFVCNPKGCSATYKWEVVGPGSSSMTGTGKTFTYTFSSPGTYEVMVYPKCGGNKCRPCKFTVSVPGRVIGPGGVVIEQKANSNL